MKNRFKITRNAVQTIISICLALFLGSTAFTLSYTKKLYVADEVVTNFVYANNPFEKADSRITIIALDRQDSSNQNPDREKLAKAISKLKEDQATIIGLNLNLSQETTASADEALVSACKNANNVIISAGVHFENNKLENSNTTENEKEQFVPVDSSFNWTNTDNTTIDYPFDALNEVVTVGASNIMQQSVDGFIRNAALSIKYQSANIDAFSVAMYKAYQQANNESVKIPSLNNQNLLEFNNIWDAKSYQIISYDDILNSNYDANLIKDHIVIIGYYTDNTDYNVFTHFEASRNQQQILLESAVLQALLTQRNVETADSTLMAVIYGIVFTVGYFLFSRRKKYIFGLIQLGIGFGGIALCYILNINGIRVLLLTPIICSGQLIIIFLIQTLAHNMIERKRVEQTLGMYVDKSVIDEISDFHPLSLNMLTERRDIAVLFVDIRGFTTLSEELDPEDVVSILNQYFSVVYASISAWNGTVDKFIGDAAMAIFNAPKDQEDYILHAVCAAIDIMNDFKDLKKDLFNRYQKEINLGIGINCGEAIVGNIGCLGRVDYTAIGDTVNTASRLESKAAPEQILVSQSVADAIKSRATLTSVGELSLKGKSKAITAYQIDNVDKPVAPNTRARKDFLYETALLYSKQFSDSQLPAFFKGK